MKKNNVSKNKMLNELAGNFVQAQEKENPTTYSNLTELELKMKESCIAKIIDENGKETFQNDNKSLAKIFEMKMADNPNFNEEYEKYNKADVSLLVLDKEDRKKLAEEINSILEDNKDVIESTKTKDKESNEINDFKKSLIIKKVEEYYDNSLNVYGKVKEIYSEDENEYKANVEAVLKTLEEGSLNNFFENLENQKEKMEKYSHSEVPIENVIHKMSYDMKGDIRQDIAKSLDFDSIVRNTATLVMIEENFTVEDAKNIKNMSDEEKSQFVDKINDYISERGSHIKEVKVSDLEKLEKVNFDKVSDLRENSYKEEQRKEKEKERTHNREERTDREYDF